MDPMILVGIFLGFIFLFRAVGFDVGMELFYHPESFLVVLGGTFAAVLVQFPISQLARLKMLFFILFKHNRYDFLGDIEELTRMSRKLKKSGRIAVNKELKNLENPFLRGALQLYMDKVKTDQLDSILNEKIEAMELRHTQGIRFFEQLAKYAPGFGLLGTLMGLILMLAKLDDPSSLGPSMSLALVTTFYGVLLANLVFLPISGRLKEKSMDEILRREIMREGILSLSRGESTFMVREKMSTLLTERQQTRLQDRLK